MPLIRRIARPLLASAFVYGGIDTLRNPGPRVPAADDVVPGIVERLPISLTTEQAVRIDAATKVLAGTTFALGKAPRLSATVLAASLVPTTAAGHRFWEEKDPAKRAQQRVHFLKNAGLLGGLLLAAADTEGRPSLAWRARRAARLSGRASHHAGQDAAAVLETLGGATARAVPRVEAAGVAAGSKAVDALGAAAAWAKPRVEAAGSKTVEAVGSAAARAVPAVEAAGAKAAANAAPMMKAARGELKAAGETAAPLLKAARLELQAAGANAAPLLRSARDELQNAAAATEELASRVAERTRVR